MKTNKILWLILGLIVVLGLFYLSQKNTKTEVTSPVTYEKIEIGGNLDQNISKEQPVATEEDILATKKSFCENDGGIWYEYNLSCEKNSLSKDQCLLAGGEFNECNSACRHDEKAEICTMQCVITCTIK